MDGGQKKLVVGQTGKGQLALTMRGERWLRRIVRSQRSQTAQITTQLNDDASRTVSKRTVQCSRHGMGSSTYESAIPQYLP
ncbi:hypothetical protein TNCV_1022801 [Trichonephila clavipes]|nr:hypothetical protein TNCV_1022801 [Trichonephila clavipes]